MDQKHLDAILRGFAGTYGAPHEPLWSRYSTFAGTLVQKVLAGRGLEFRLDLAGVDEDVVEELFARLPRCTGWSAERVGGELVVKRDKASRKPIF